MAVKVQTTVLVNSRIGWQKSELFCLLACFMGDKSPQDEIKKVTFVHLGELIPR